MKSASVARPERDEFIHSTAEAQETHRAPPLAASLGATKSHLDPFPRYLSVQRPTSYFLAANPQQIRTIGGIGKGSLKPSTNPKMAKHATQKSFQEVDLRHHPRVMTIEGPGERVRPSAAKQTTVEVKEEPPHAWRVSLGSSDSHKCQSQGLWVFRGHHIPTHLHIPISQHSQDSSQNILSSNQLSRA